MSEDSLAEVDQTSSDADHTIADSDQTSADSDQTSADDDQLAADRDQAASDRDLADGADRRTHELSHEVRERSSRQRENAARRRDEAAAARLLAAGRRDAVAETRDLAARARDAAAEARTIEMAELDAASQRDDDARSRTGAEVIIRAAGQRKRAAHRRAQAAHQREMAARDREAAAHDREQAARERQQALVDREALVLEIRREQDRRARATRHQHSAEDLAHTLQRTLSPPRLPRVDGFDVAAYYEPFATEEVGGDFYDVFPLAAGRSGFFLGDVCGKGPPAAMLTSLARYTMRTAAMLRDEPAAILADLNTALLVEGTDSMQTCTVVYGQIDVDGERLTVTLAAAGHPAPLIVRANGSVETTPATGTLLGAIEDPRFRICEVDLEPGDAVFVYSDGALDATIDGERVDEQALAGLLEGPPGACAQALVERLVQSLRRSDRPLRDDVALLALRRSPAA
jgi:serine phosphatase RsbU (regulator of sigma subunit)